MRIGREMLCLPYAGFFFQWIDLGSKKPLQLAHSGYQDTKIFGTEVWGGSLDFNLYSSVSGSAKDTHRAFDMFQNVTVTQTVWFVLLTARCATLKLDGVILFRLCEVTIRQ